MIKTSDSRSRSVKNPSEQRTPSKRESVADIDLKEVSRIRDTMFENNSWYGFRIIVLGNFYTGAPSARVLRDFGLTRDEMSILSSLHHWGGLTANIIVGLTGRPKNSISRAVIRLVRDGLVSSRVDDEDRRRQILTIEPVGEALYDKAAAVFLAREDEMFGCLSKSETAALDAILRKLLQNWGKKLARGVERYITEY
jgi:DNA-binding MarR family transcriptional regulator